MLGAGETMVAQNNFPKPPGIERLDPALDQLIAPDAAIEVLAGGYDWTEGPVWVKNGGYLLFSDIPPNQIHRWKEGEGAKLYLTPSGYTGTEKRGGEVGSNGLTLDREGRLVLAQHGDRRIARMDAPLSKPQPKFTTLADRYQGARLQQSQRSGVSSNGDIYFTDPAYGMEKQWDDPKREMNYAGVFRRTPRRHGDAPDEGDDAPQRDRVLARRTAPLCGPVGPGRRDLARVRREERRHDREQPRPVRRHHARQVTQGTARRHEDRHGRQPLRDRPRRRAR